jgi:glucose-6-phosphate 1-dehydrogenase
MLSGMEQTDSLDELLICRLDLGRKVLEPCSIVIFGASGDLTSRKLIPALYQLFVEKQLPTPFRIIGFARREKKDEVWREELKGALAQFSRTKKVDPQQWQAFSSSLFYSQGDFSDPKAYDKLGSLLASFGQEELCRNVLFYLATSPSQFAEVVEHLHDARLLVKGDTGKFWQRVVIEKPFGHDLASAKQLNAELTRYANEKQIFRIDHYLGKETVQNILMFRFSNAIFEQLWNRESVDHVQITVSEQLGVGTRGGYYEEAGALRDMVQNHLLQVLALITMEPPASLEAESIRDEKVKVLKSIRVLDPSQVPLAVVRGQYTSGTLNGEMRPAYRQEPKVQPDSNVETFVALKFFVDNWRWSGVPFYLRTGKNLPLSASEVRVQFRPPPHVLFAAQCGPKLDANAITIRLQPNEGITLRFNGKIPGTSMQLRPVRMHFSYDSEFGAYTPEAYERLLLEALAGDATLFIRRDEVEIAWSIVDPIRQAWDDQSLSEREFYPAGSWGPAAAEELLKARGHSWRNPQPVA